MTLPGAVHGGGAELVDIDGSRIDTLQKVYKNVRETRINDKVQLKVQLKNDIALRRFRETQP